jgi:hypothetical protein
MGRIAGVLCALLVVSAVATPAIAGEDELMELGVNREATITKMLTRLQQCQPQEMQEIAFDLGEAKATEAVIPLMRMLHEGQEQCRIVAALALCRIGDDRGTFAVKQAVRFDRSERVQQLAAWFYEQYVKPGTYRFVAEDASHAAPVAGR